MARVAVLVDLGYFLPRYRVLIEKGAQQRHTPTEVANNLWRTAIGHVRKQDGEQLYRILVYDCAPLSKRAHNPVSGRSIDFSKTSLFAFRTALHRALICKRKVALRLGELSDGQRWTLTENANRVAPSLHDHIDGLRLIWPNPCARANSAAGEIAVAPSSI